MRLNAMAAAAALTLGLLALTRECSSITRVSSARPPYEFYRDEISSSINAPPTSLPWEEALRHSVYLTLIRDRIDALIWKRGEIEGDADLWHDIRRAPFVMRSRKRGPVFGDIAILSRGRLVRSPGGRRLRFVEDEEVRECIECRPYANDVEPRYLDDVPEGTEALWTVRRIRHRSDSPYRYELTFSVATPGYGRDKRRLDYNSPTQTFTVTETDGDRRWFQGGERVRNRPEEVLFPEANRGGKRYEIGDAVTTEGDPMTVVHLHHHYYKHNKQFVASDEEVKYSEPDPLYHSTPSPPTQTTQEIIIEQPIPRKAKKPQRRGRVQKKFIVDTPTAQLPPPETTTAMATTTTPTTTTTITTSTSTEETTSRRSPRRKYQRKPGTWLRRRTTTTTTPDSASVETTLSTPVDTTTADHQQQSVATEDTVVAHTKQSFVTSISLKLGNKTRAYRKRDKPKVFKVSKPVEDLPDEYNKEAQVTEINGAEKNVTIYKTEEEQIDGGGGGETTTLNDDGESEVVTKEIVERAKSVRKNK